MKQTTIRQVITIITRSRSNALQRNMQRLRVVTRVNQLDSMVLLRRFTIRDSNTNLMISTSNITTFNSSPLSRQFTVKHMTIRSSRVSTLELMPNAPSSRLFAILRNKRRKLTVRLGSPRGRQGSRRRRRDHQSRHLMPFGYTLTFHDF